MKTEFKKGQVKQMFEFNQEAKHIFESYMFKNDNFVIGNTDSKGRHFVERGFMLCDDSNIHGFDPKDLYELLKTGRKDITEWECHNNQYYINDKCFGYSLGDSFNYEYKCNIFKVNMERFNESPYIVNLNDDDIYNLMKNKILGVKSHIYESRISRKIIPGLKKKHKVQIRFYIGEFPDVFNMHIKVDRGVLVSHHIYQCIKF